MVQAIAAISPHLNARPWTDRHIPYNCLSLYIIWLLFCFVLFYYLIYTNYGHYGYYVPDIQQVRFFKSLMRSTCMDQVCYASITIISLVPSIHFHLIHSSQKKLWLVFHSCTISWFTSVGACWWGIHCSWQYCSATWYGVCVLVQLTWRCRLTPHHLTLICCASLLLLVLWRGTPQWSTMLKQRFNWWCGGNPVGTLCEHWQAFLEHWHTQQQQQKYAHDVPRCARKLFFDDQMSIGFWESSEPHRTSPVLPRKARLDTVSTTGLPCTGTCFPSWDDGMLRWKMFH
jgi:hypothetical protein